MKKTIKHAIAVALIVGFAVFALGSMGSSPSSGSSYSGGGSYSSGGSSSVELRSWTVDVEYWDSNNDRVGRIRYTGVMAAYRTDAEIIAENTWRDNNSNPNNQFISATAQ
ncbi:MAG: hypothetical protein FWF55_08245 [Treponema sp.]|nr:hypothetical protein [Treponema sp.]